MIVLHPVAVTEVNPGNTVVLQCVGYGFPTPLVNWTQNETTLRSESNTTIREEIVNEGGVGFFKSTLEICSINASVAYDCAVVSSTGNSTFAFRVILQAEGQRPATIEVHPNNHVEINAGNSLILTCVGYGVPLPFLYWSRGGRELTNNSRVIITEDMALEGDSGVAVVKLSMEICRSGTTDAGFYSCTAVNDIGNSTFMFMLSVRIEEAEIVVHPEFLTYVDHGDTALFTCAAYGTPLPSITWSNLAAPNSSYNNESEFRIYQNLLRLNGVAFITSILEACRVNSSSHSCIDYIHS